VTSGRESDKEDRGKKNGAEDVKLQSQQLRREKRCTLSEIGFRDAGDVLISKETWNARGQGGSGTRRARFRLRWGRKSLPLQRVISARETWVGKRVEDRKGKMTGELRARL